MITLNRAYLGNEEVVAEKYGLPAKPWHWKRGYVRLSSVVKYRKAMHHNDSIICSDSEEEVEDVDWGEFFHDMVPVQSEHDF